MARPTVRTRITAAGDKRVARGTSRPISDAESADQRAEHGHWTFLTNHSHVLILLARNPSMILREVATIVGITERAVQRIIADLEGEGCIQREKVGRQNHYRIIRGRKLRHAIEAHRTIGDLLSILDEPG